MDSLYAKQSLSAYNCNIVSKFSIWQIASGAKKVNFCPDNSIPATDMAYRR